MHHTSSPKAVALLLLLASCFLVSEAGWFKPNQSASLLGTNGTADGKTFSGKNKTLAVTAKNGTLSEAIPELSNQTTGGLLGRKGGLGDVGGAVLGLTSKDKPKKEVAEGGWFGKFGGGKTGGSEGDFEEDQDVVEESGESEIEAKTMPGTKGTQPLPQTNKSLNVTQQGPADSVVLKKPSSSRAGTKAKTKKKSGKKKSKAIEEYSDSELKPFELNSTAFENMTSVDDVRSQKVQPSENGSVSEESGEQLGKAWALGWFKHQKKEAENSSQAVGSSDLQAGISKALANKTRVLDEEELAGSEEDKYAALEDNEEESEIRKGVQKDKRREGAKRSGVVSRKGESDGKEIEEEVTEKLKGKGGKTSKGSSIVSRKGESDGEEVEEEVTEKLKGKRGKASKGSGIVTRKGEPDGEGGPKKRTGLQKGKGGRGSGVGNRTGELDGEQGSEKSSVLQKGKRVEDVKGSGVVPRKGGILGAIAKAATGKLAGEEEDEGGVEEEGTKRTMKKHNVTQGLGTNSTFMSKNITSSGLLGTANASDALAVPVKKGESFWGRLVGGDREDEIDEESEEESLEEEEMNDRSNGTEAILSARVASKNATEEEETDESDEDEYAEEGLETESVKGEQGFGRSKGSLPAKAKNVTRGEPGKVPGRSAPKGKQHKGILGKKAADALANVTKPLGRLFSAAGNATQNATTPHNTSSSIDVLSKMAEAKKETASIMKNITRVSPQKRNGTQTKTARFFGTESTQDEIENDQDKPRQSKTDKKGSKTVDIQAAANETLGVISNQTGVKPNPERGFGETGAGRVNGTAADWPGYEDEYDTPFVNNLFNRDTLGAVQEKAKTHIVPQVQAFSQATSDAYDSTHKQIRTKLDGVVGPKASGATATVIVILLLLVPGVAVVFLCRKLKAVFSLQVFIFVCSVYLALQSLILTLFALVHKEPLALFQRNLPDAYVLYQFISLLAFVIFLVLCTMSFSAAFRTEELVQRILGGGQLLLALGVGVHYFGAIWQPAMMDKPPHVTWTTYGLYTLAFMCVCIITWFRRSRHEVMAAGGSAYKQL